MLYTIKLVSFNNDEIIMIDLCMTLCGLSMSEAAKCVDHMPSVLIKNADESKVQQIKKEFEAAGAVLKIISADEEAAMDPNDNGAENVAEFTSDNDVATDYQYSNNDYNSGGYDYNMNNTYDNVQRYDEQLYDNVQEYNYQQYDDSQGYDNSQQYDNSQVYDDNQQYGEGMNDNSSIDVNDYSYTEDNQGYQNDEQSVVRMGEPAEEENAVEEAEEEESSSVFESCPRCGSTFVSVKKGNGLFGNQKMRYVCDACKHKF